MACSTRLVLGFLLLLGLPFGASCGEASSDEVVAAIRVDPCRPFAVVVDAAATPAQRQGAAAALDAWSAVAAVRGTVTADAGGSETLPLRFQVAAAPSHGFYDPATGSILINEDLSERPLAVTIAHELGHAFGLAHVAERPSVMNVGNIDVEPSPDDAAVLAAAWGACVSRAN